jgi:hypothetical protein
VQEDCAKGVEDVVLAQRELALLIRDGLKERAFFVNNYHSEYRMAIELCVCRRRFAVRFEISPRDVIKHDIFPFLPCFTRERR